MLTDATIGSKVVLLDWNKIIGQATITGETNCYWILSNTERVKKDLGYYWETCSKRKKIDVKPWTQEFEGMYQAHLKTKEIAAILSAQKSKLDDYIDHMRSGYFSRLTAVQIANILSVCESEIGELPSRHR